MKRLVAGFALALGVAASAAADEAGRKLYDKNCAQCHGEKGDGNGPAAPHLSPRPRDLTLGKYKIRTTANGELPTDEDLKNIIRRGMPYTSMPPWNFTDAELTSLVDYVKTFHAGFADASRKPEAFPAAPAVTADSVANGAKQYENLGCAGCHGEHGRGDGPTALTLEDEAGYPIRAANLTQRWTFRGGATREDIYRTLNTGLNGTPMPSFRDALKPEERWQLVDFLASLGPEAPGYGTLLTALPVDDEIDVTAAALFDKAVPVRFPVLGQVVEPGRAFAPSTTSVVVRAVYDQNRIAFRIDWDDARADQGGRNGPDLAVSAEDEVLTTPPAAPTAEAGGDDPWGGAEGGDPFADQAAPADDPWGEPTAPAGAGAEFSDAVAIQLPAQLPTGFEKPYFLFGDGSNPVDLWFLDTAGAASRVRQFVGRGSASLTALEAGDVEGRATFADGTWSAVFVRELRSTTGVGFREDQFVPIAFSVWDGTARERGNRRGLTQWFYVYVPPRERPSPLLPMLAAGAAVLVLEVLVVLALRRRRRRMAAVAA